MKWLLIILSIIVVLVIFFWSGRPNERFEVEIRTTPGTKVFITLPGGQEEYLTNVSTLDNGPITVSVPIDAKDIILRYNSQEKVFPPETWEEGVSQDFAPRFDRVAINADPDAEVFIILPGTHEEKFIDDVPLTMEVPIGATVILEYEDKKRVFYYKQGRKEIYHNFLPR